VGAGLALFTEEVGDLPAQPRDLCPELGAFTRQPAVFGVGGLQPA